jgi:serine/threonine protein kinase
MTDYADSLIGQQVGNYRLLRLLGQGGFADVYLGEHIHLNTNAAIDQTNGLIIALMNGSNQNSYGSNLNQNSYTPDTKYHTYRVEVKTNTITLFLDGQQIGQATDNTYLNARQVGLRAYDAEINVTSFKVFAL